jgi:hypothetical protein
MAARVLCCAITARPVIRCWTATSSTTGIRAGRPGSGSGWAFSSVTATGIWCGATGPTATRATDSSSASGARSRSNTTGVPERRGRLHVRRRGRTDYGRPSRSSRRGVGQRGRRLHRQVEHALSNGTDAVVGGKAANDSWQDKPSRLRSTDPSEAEGPGPLPASSRRPRSWRPETARERRCRATKPGVPAASSCRWPSGPRFRTTRKGARTRPPAWTKEASGTAI